LRYFTPCALRSSRYSSVASSSCVYGSDIAASVTPAAATARKNSVIGEVRRTRVGKSKMKSEGSKLKRSARTEVLPKDI
jgi:hypothetical protein